MVHQEGQKWHVRGGIDCFGKTRLDDHIFHLCNLRKSVDEPMVRDSDTTHPQITQITQMRRWMTCHFAFPDVP